jgi:hypothetical protein
LLLYAFYGIVTTSEVTTLGAGGTVVLTIADGGLVPQITVGD